MLRNGLRSAVRPALTPALNKLNAVARAVRHAYSLDGADDRFQLQFKAVNMDGDPTLEFYTPSDFLTPHVIISQNSTGTFSSREFQLFTSTLGAGLFVVWGGTNTNIITVAQGLKTNTKYGLALVGTEAKLYEGGLTGTLVRVTTFTRGNAREPAAITKIGCNSDNLGHANFSNGPQYDVKINGILWPIADRKQSIQLPIPSGLGAELITQTVLENPAFKGSQWTYLGAGRWQYIGDGSLNDLVFISSQNQPNAGFLEFEVESISGTMMCSQSGSAISSSFSTVGVKRYYYTTKDHNGVANANCALFKRQSGVANCIIKNISLKPLWTVNAAELLTNGDFSAGTTGWSVTGSGTLSVSAGQAKLTTASGQPSRFEQGVVLEPLAWYEYSATLISFSGVAFARLQMLRGAAGSFRQILGVNFTAGRMSVVFQAPAADGIAQIIGDTASAGTVVVDNVSLRKLDSICNPLTMINTTSDRWLEVN